MDRAENELALSPAIAGRGVHFCGQHSRLTLPSAFLPLVWIEQRPGRLPERRLDNSRFVSAAKSPLTAGCAIRWVCKSKSLINATGGNLQRLPRAFKYDSHSPRPRGHGRILLNECE
jgi:hypothetical protein